MRIGIDIRELEKGKYTGIGRVIRNFLKYAAEHDHDNEYVLFGNQKTDFTPLSNNQRMVIIPEGVTLIWDQVKLPLAISREKIDLFFSLYFKAPLFTSAKLINLVHDVTPLVVKLYLGPGYFLKRLYFRVMSWLVLKKSKKIISISESTKKDYVRIFKVPEEKIKVIPLCVDREFKKVEVGKEFKDKYGITKDYVLYVGNLKPHKNVPAVIESYQSLKTELKQKYQLIIIAKKDEHYQNLLDELSGKQYKPDPKHPEELEGYKSEEEWHEDNAEKISIEGVLFLDQVDIEDLPKFYSGAKVFMFLSHYEGFGLPVLEAMACGTAVIVSDISSLPEVVGDAGIKIGVNSSGHDLEQLLTDDPMREKLEELGQTRAEYFTLEKMGSEILKVFQDA